MAWAQPAQAQCLPAPGCRPGGAPAGNAVFQMGIFRVQIANLDTTTRGSGDGYQDYSCQRPARVSQSTSYTIRVTTGADAEENVRAWADFNQDGSFDPGTEQVLASTGRQHVGTFLIPTSVPVGTSLRLRIAADYANVPVPGVCSTPQYSQTEDYRLLVTSAMIPVPRAAFSALDSVTCSGTVRFRDQSRNAVTAWQWDFGDGTTSTQQHPQHTYATPGTYSVQLRACNATGCDSFTKLNFVVFRADAPRPAPCQPVTTASCCGFGVTRVRLGQTLDNASADGAVGYEDFSCAQRTTLTADRPQVLQLTTGLNAHDVRVYLDVNDNGQFDLPAELLYEGLGVRNPTISLNVTSVLSGLIYRRPLRLRVWVDAAGTTPFGPCAATLRGQVEDYAVEVLPNVMAPRATFTVTNVQYCGPTRVAFANATVGGATSYH